MPLQDTPKLPLSTSVSSSRLSLAYLIYLIQRVRSYRRSLLDAKLSRARPRQTWQSRRYALSRSRTARRASGPLTAFNWVGACTRRTASRPGSARPRCRQPRDCSTALLRDDTRQRLPSLQQFPHSPIGVTRLVTERRATAARVVGLWGQPNYERIVRGKRVTLFCSE